MHSADRGDANRSGKRPFYVPFWMSISAAGILACFGIWLMTEGTEKEAERRNSVVLVALTNQMVQERSASANRFLTLETRFNDLSIQLKAAKSENTLQINQEKLRTIQADITNWAEQFTQQIPERQRAIQKVKVDMATKQEEEKASENSRRLPIISFAYGIFKDYIAAYKSQTGKDIKIEFPAVPTDFSIPHPEPLVTFPDGASWGVEFGNLSNQTIMAIRFSRKGGMTGNLHIALGPDNKRFSISYSPVFSNTADPLVSTEGELSNYEGGIRKVIQAAIESQIAQMEQ
jgi:hypothetical protein